MPTYPRWCWLKINFGRFQHLRSASQLAASFTILLYTFIKVLRSYGFLPAAEAIHLMAILTTPLILQMDHFRCLALLARHCFAPSFSEGWLPHAAETTFVLHFHHFWCLAMLATHGFATRFSIIALRSFATYTPLVHHIHHFRCLTLLATHSYAPSFSKGWLAPAAKTTLAYDIHPL